MPRSSLLAPHRWVFVVLLVVLAALAFLGARGPAWFQKRYYPLRYEREIDAAAVRHRINPYLIAAIASAESDFARDVVSPAGAMGLMQVMPETARELERRGRVDESVVRGKELTDAQANIEFGTAYVRYLVDRYHEVETVLAAYNAGLRHADEWSEEGGDIREAIEFPETKAYVLKVVRARERYEKLYPNAFPSWKGANPDE